MNLDLTDKNALVCGSTAGIGKATAIQLAKLGATVTLVARDEEKLKETLIELAHDKGQKHNYFVATLIFAFLWAFWHFPLFFIKDYYQYQLIHSNVWFAINFMVSIFPMAINISWICQKNGGSIMAAIIFHFIINLSQEALEITQITKCIETIVLTFVAAFIVLSNKKMFFDKHILNPAYENNRK